MSIHSFRTRAAVRRLLFWLLTAIMISLLLLTSARTAGAQCVANPAGETAVGLRNATRHYLLFFIDGFRMDGVPPGDRSTYFVVPPGEHLLRAEAVIREETFSATHTVEVPQGAVCTWTVTDPAVSTGGAPKELRDGLRREHHPSPPPRPACVKERTKRKTTLAPEHLKTI